jgi:hypothetical protein
VRLWAAIEEKFNCELGVVLSGIEYMETQQRERIGEKMITVNDAYS